VTFVVVATSLWCWWIFTRIRSQRSDWQARQRRREFNKSLTNRK
jgi:hypothetical protein